MGGSSEDKNTRDRSAGLSITLFKEVDQNGRYNPAMSAKGEAVHQLSMQRLADIITTHSWAPALFKDNIRNNKNFISTDSITLDFDEKVTHKEVIKRLESYGWNYILTFSKSHMKEKNGKIEERFRLLLPLAEPVKSSSHFKSTWNLLKEIFPEQDVACKDQARFFFRSNPGDMIIFNDGVDLIPPSDYEGGSIEVPAEENLYDKPKFLLVSRLAQEFLSNAHKMDGKYNSVMYRVARDLNRGGFTETQALRLIQGASPRPLDNNDMSSFRHNFNHPDNKPFKLPGVKSGEFKLTPEDSFDIIENNDERTFRIAEDEQGRRSIILEEMPKKVVKISFEETICQLLAKKAYEKHDLYMTAQMAKNHVESWILHTTPIKEEIRSIARLDQDVYAYNKLDFLPQKQETPVFDEMMSRLTNNKAIMAFIWSLFEPDADRQQYVWIQGEGADGKSSLSRFLETIMGGAYVARDTNSSYDNKFYTSGFIGKRLAVFNDTNSTRFIRSGLFKQLTGGDSVEVEEKYKSSYSVKLDIKSMILSNQLPELSTQKADQRRPILGRMKAIKGELISENEYLAKMMKEKAGILYKCREMYNELTVNHSPIKSDDRLVRMLGENHDHKYRAIVKELLDINKNNSINSLEFFSIVIGSCRRMKVDYHIFKHWLLNKYEVKEERNIDGENELIGVGIK